MMLDTAQLMLSFEPDDPSKYLVRLRVSRSEREYFERGTRASEGYSIFLPPPFIESAFNDEGSWRKTPRRSDVAASLGLNMWNNLPPSLTGEIANTAPGEPRRLCIVSRSSGMDDIPWEWVNGGQPPLAADDRFRFMRIVPCPYASPPLTVTPPIRVLMVMTNPKDERLLIPQEEMRLLSGGLQPGGGYEVRQLWEPKIDALRASLEWTPHIVHYVGHAGLTGQNGALILHDDREGTRWVTATELSRLLPSSVRLLCLSTCVTAPNYQISGLLHVAHSPADLSLPTTIVNQYALEPTAVEAFWSLFYPQLVTCGGDVVEAFHRARLSLYSPAAGTWSWASFSLVVRDGTGRPMRIDAPSGKSEARFAAEVQAQWSARLANSLAQRMQTLDPKVREIMADTLGSEEARIDELREKLDKM